MNSIRLFLFFILFVCSFSATKLHAQGGDLARARAQLQNLPDSLSLWKYSCFASLTCTQTTFDNWAAGGVNNVSVVFLGNAALQYKKDRWTWDNLLDMGYGMVQNEDEDLRKNEDRIDLLSKIGYQQTEKLAYAFRGNLKTQFAEGFISPNDSVPASRFFAPAYVLASLGLDYKPVPYFSIFFSPITAKYTIVTNQDLADAGAYGVDPAVYGPDGTRLQAGKNVRAEYGALLALMFKKDWERFGVQSRLELFNNYSDPVTDNRRNIDVNWETLINVAVTKYFGVSGFWHLIYDQNTPVPLFEKQNGEKIQVGTGPRLQFKQVLGLSLNYRFSTFPKED